MAFGKMRLAAFILLTILLLSHVAFAAEITYYASCSDPAWGNSCNPGYADEKVKPGKGGTLTCTYQDDALPQGAVVTQVDVIGFARGIPIGSSLPVYWAGSQIGVFSGTFASTGCSAAASFDYPLANPQYTYNGPNTMTFSKSGTATGGIAGGTAVGWKAGQHIQVKVTYTPPNTAPSATVSISPSSPSPTDTITCTAQITDAEQQTLNFVATLLINNAAAVAKPGTAQNNTQTPVISSTFPLSVGDTLKCQLDYNDSVLSGQTAYSSEVTVVAGGNPGTCGTPNSGAGTCGGGTGTVSSCGAITAKGQACCTAATGCTWQNSACTGTSSTISCYNYDNNEVGCESFEPPVATCGWIHGPLSCGAKITGSGNCSGGTSSISCSDMTDGGCCEAVTNCIWQSSHCVAKAGVHQANCYDYDDNEFACKSFPASAGCVWKSAAPATCGQTYANSGWCDSKATSSMYCGMLSKACCETSDSGCTWSGGACHGGYVSTSICPRFNNNKMACLGVLQGQTCTWDANTCSNISGACNDSRHDCCSGFSCEQNSTYTGGKICCIAAGSNISCIFGSQCCSGICTRHVCQPNECDTIPTIRSFTDITLDPDHSVMSVFVYDQNATTYVKTPIPDALLFMVNLTDKQNIRLCYTKTGADGKLAYPYNPKFPGCLDNWFIFCPLGDAATNSVSRYRCLNSTHLSDSLLAPNTDVCPNGTASAATSYPDHILSHNELYFCNKVPRDYAPLCWPLMLILGLLLGASFAVGKNPLQMFDMSSPRLARGRQYSARVQNKSFDLLSYAMGAASGAMSVKSDVKSIQTGGFMGPIKNALGLDPKRGPNQQKKFDEKQKQKQDKKDQKNAGQPPKSGGGKKQEGGGDKKQEGGGQKDSGRVVSGGGVGGVFGSLMAQLNIGQGGGKEGRQKRRQERKEAKAEAKKIAPAKNQGDGTDKQRGSGVVAGGIGAGGVAAGIAFSGLSGYNPVKDTYLGIKNAGVPTRVDSLIMDFSLKGKNFGQSLLAILKLLVNIILDQYGMSTDSIKGIFEKGSWKGVTPVVKSLMELVKLLLALYSIMSEISNYCKSIQVMKGKGDRAKGFMDDFNDSSMFKIGNYNLSTNALAGWLDPRLGTASTSAGMPSTGTAPSIPYPLGYIISPVLDGVGLGLEAAASAIDHAVDKKRFEKDAGKPKEMITSSTPAANGGIAAKEGDVGVTAGPNNTDTYYKCQEAKETKDGMEVTTKKWVEDKSINADNLPEDTKTRLANAVPQYIKNDGTMLSNEKRMDHQRRLAIAIDLKVDAGKYLLKNFGGVFGDARRNAIGENISALETQANVLRNPYSSAADLKIAQDYVNTTRDLMGKVNSHETMNNAIEMAYIKTGDDNADAQAKADSDKKKMALGARMEELQAELDQRTPGTHAYNAIKGEITEIEATLALCTMLENLNVQFDKSQPTFDKSLLKDTNKIMQEFFVIQLEETALSKVYLTTNNSATKEAIANLFEIVKSESADFKNGKIGSVDELRTKLDAMQAQLNVAKEFIIPGSYSGMLGSQSGKEACENWMAASGMLATAQANERKAKKELAKAGVGSSTSALEQAVARAEAATAKAEVMEASANAEFGKVLGISSSSALADALKTASSIGPLAKMIEKNNKNIKEELAAYPKRQSDAYKWSNEIENAASRGKFLKEGGPAHEQTVARVQNEIQACIDAPTKKNFEAASKFRDDLWANKLLDRIEPKKAETIDVTADKGNAGERMLEATSKAQQNQIAFAQKSDAQKEEEQKEIEIGKNEASSAAKRKGKK